jgi:hypothetical protein
VGAALKTLGLGLNASAADLAAAGLSARDVRARMEQLRRQVPAPLCSFRMTSQSRACGGLPFMQIQCMHAANAARFYSSP